MGIDSYRKVLGVVEGPKEDKAGWSNFLYHLRERGLLGVRLIISVACMGLVESAGEYYPQAKWQRCTVHFYRNVFSVVPRRRMAEVAAMLKAVHASEDLGAALEKAEAVCREAESHEAAQGSREGKGGDIRNPSLLSFPPRAFAAHKHEYALERIMKEIRRRTRVVGAFPDDHSALMLWAAGLRHIACTKWCQKRYLNMGLLNDMELEEERSLAEAI